MLAFDVVEPSVLVEPACVVGLEELDEDDCPVAAVVDEVVDGSVDGNRLKRPLPARFTCLRCGLVVAANSGSCRQRAADFVSRHAIDFLR